MAEEKTCVNCAWACWTKKKKTTGEINYTSGGICTLEISLPNCYIDPSRPGDRCWPWRRPVTKFTRPNCYHWRKS